jgi:hypothetical protein
MPAPLTADRALDEPTEVEAKAWASAIPIGLALAAGVAWLVPPLARALGVVLSPSQQPLARVADAVRPEPEEQALYVVCLVVPAVAAWALAALGSRLSPPVRPTRIVAVAVQLALAVGVVATWAYQDRSVHRYFEPIRWALGLAVVLGLAWLLARFRGGAVAGPRSPLVPALAAAAVAAAYTAARLSGAVYDDASIQAAPINVSYHVSFTLDEFAAVLNGRTAWVDYFPQYATVLPYLLAPAFRVSGLDVRTFTLGMAALSFVGLAMQHDVFRRVTGSPWAAVALYLPFAALAFFPTEVYRTIGSANSFNYYAHAPLRYLGPWLVGWLVAWHQSRPGGRRLLVLFAAAGLAAVNNLDFGVPALGAALLAVLLGGPGGIVPRAADALRVLAAAALGVALAIGALVAVSWVRSGAIVDLGRMVLFQRAFAVSGFNMLPMPPWGIHWLVYATFMIGLATALFRLGALRGAPPAVAAGGAGGDARLAASVLLFASVFGAGALALYVGRSHWAMLVGLFPAWASALMLLCWLALRPAIRGGRAWLSRNRAVPLALAIAAYALCVGELLPYPRPKANVGFPPSLGAAKVSSVVNAPSLASAIRGAVAPGEKVMITVPGGHLVALLAGVQNVYPFAEDESCILQGQVELVAETIRSQRVSKYVGPMPPELEERLRRDPVPWSLEVLGVRQPPIAPGWPE